MSKIIAMIYSFKFSQLVQIVNIRKKFVICHGKYILYTYYYQCWERTRSFYRNKAQNVFYLKYRNKERESVPIFKELERKFPFLKK